MQEPEVSCIAKGKAHKKYEFGSKIGIVSTIENSFVLAVGLFLQNTQINYQLERSNW